MENTTFSITELEDATKINRRTIHYYSQKKIIPPPEGKGGSAKYGLRHYYSLILIKQMQKSHLKLSGIKEALDSMSIDELDKLAKAAQKSTVDWDNITLENWMNAELNLNTGIATEPDASYSNENISFLNVPKRKRSNKNESYLSRIKREPASSKTAWERFEIIKGIEIHIRGDIMKKHKSILLGWVEYLKDLATKYL